MSALNTKVNTALFGATAVPLQHYTSPTEKILAFNKTKTNIILSYHYDIIITTKTQKWQTNMKFSACYDIIPL